MSKYVCSNDVKKKIQGNFSINTDMSKRNDVMKKIILLALTTLMMVGCGCKTDAEIEEQNRLNGFNIVVIDSCEYLCKKIPAGYAGYGFMAHKGNCRFCKERRQKELKELVERLNEK